MFHLLCQVTNNKGSDTDADTEGGLLWSKTQPLARAVKNNFLKLIDGAQNRNHNTKNNDITKAARGNFHRLGSALWTFLGEKCKI